MERKRGLLICFTGIDGSGKTTHAKSLVDFLNKNGYMCTYVWAASRPILSLVFFAFARVLGFWKTTKKGMYTDPLEFAPNRLRDKLGAIWRLFLFIDFQMKVSVTIRDFLIDGRVVVCDRYVYDMMMELQLSGLYTTNFGKLITKTVPKPSVTFLMDVPEDTASSRRQISAEGLSARRKLFLEMAQIYDFVLVDSTEDFYHNRCQIQDTTLSKLKTL